MNVLLFHLDAAGRDTLAGTIRDDGHEVTAVSAAPDVPVVPDVFVVCLDASPQRALDLAAKIAAAAQVAVPSMLFVGGPPAALAEAQRRFPSASFARIDALATALASMEQ
jgi:hypothetical protein